MPHRSHLRLYVFGVVFGLAVSCLAAGARDNSFFYRKYKAPPPSAKITVTVLRNDDDTPIANAAVIFHPIKGDKDKGGMELKSDQDGKATITVIPIGDTVLLQIIANGYQTYGGVYKIDKKKMAMKIRLKLPQPQYSIYKNHNTAANSGQGSGAGKAANPAKSPNSSPSKDKPSTSAKEKPPVPAKEKPSSPAEQDAQNSNGQSQAQQK